MLSLTRRVGESVILELPNGDLIKVKITSNSGGQMSLCFVAPRYVSIDREEIFQRKQAERSGEP